MFSKVVSIIVAIVKPAPFDYAAYAADEQARIDAAKAAGTYVNGLDYHWLYGKVK